MKRLDWSELFPKMEDWRAANQASVSETAKHFKVSESSYASARIRTRAKSKSKKMIHARKPTTFVDVVHSHDAPKAEGASDKLIVVMGTISQVAKLMEALNANHSGNL